MVRPERRRSSLSEDERLSMARSFHWFDPWLRIRQTMPIQYLRTFLAVAMDEGKGVSDYQEVLRVPQSVMSRHLLDLGERDRTGVPGSGYGLIEIQMDPDDRRRHVATLTAKGRKLARDLHKLCQSEP
jgi:DNA-binding MarR family transcriptional regulator